MNKSLEKLTKKAKRQLNVVLTHSETLVNILTELNNLTDEELGQIKKGPGRPLKASSQTTMVKKQPGRPRKDSVVFGLSTPATNRRRGRPSKIEAALDNTLKAEVERIRLHINDYNQWWNESTQKREIWKIENGTYLAIIEGFYSSGESGRYGITTRIYINPSSNILPENLKGHIDTAAVNRIRYVENKEQGLKYIDRQKAKVKEQFFNDILPTIIDNHGKKGSVYAFHLDNQIRNKFKELQVAVNKIPSLKKKAVV